MRLVLISVFICSFSLLFGQDKIYLKDNSLVTGNILSEDGKFIEISKEGESIRILHSDISIILYENGESKVISKEPETKVEFRMNEWMIGTNILQPVSLAGGFMIEKNITRRYSIRAGQVFMFDSNYGNSASCTSLMNNFYFGKGKVKWLVSGGLNLFYTESPYYPYPITHSAIADYETMDIIWMPRNGWRSYLDVEFSFGTGIFIDLTKHCAFLFQMNLGAFMDRNYFNVQLDVANSGFSFFYKF